MQTSHDAKKKEIPTSLVGIRLREERERIGITQADAALLAGCTREQWGRYERGANASADVLLRLQGQGFDVNYILGGQRLMNAEATLTDEEAALLRCFRAARPEGKSALLRLGKSEAMEVLMVDEAHRSTGGAAAPTPNLPLVKVGSTATPRRKKV